MVARRRIAGKKPNGIPLWHFKQNSERAKSSPTGRDPRSEFRSKTRKWIAIAAVAALLVGSCVVVYGWWRRGAMTRALRRHQCNKNGGTPPPSRSNIILVASHLRRGSDGELRLRIIEHNLRLLAKREHAKPLKCVVVFSTDAGDGFSSGEEGILRDMVEQWRRGPAIDGMVDEVLFVPNDAVLVDASKWMTALYRLLPELERTNARVMLLNDSFLLTRPVPALWDDACGGVCGLVWTADPSDKTRHIQSYLRSLSMCEVFRYIRFYEENKLTFHDVNDIIQHFEIVLSWAESASALFDYVGAHPDSEAAQRVSAWESG